MYILTLKRRCLMIILLMIASICLLEIEDYGLGVMGYYQNNVFTYFHDMQGSNGSDDPAMFGAAGVIGCIFAIFLFFPLFKHWIIGIFVSIYVLKFMILAMVDIPLNIIISDSLRYAENYWIVAWLLFEMLFALTSLLLIKKMNYVDKEQI